jgi:hypothetical protein
MSTTPPVTPRFRLIRDAFSPDPRNEDLQAYLSSASLTSYNASLSEFRNRVLHHIMFLGAAIRRVQDIQAQRTATKALSKTRFASFWSLEHCRDRASIKPDPGPALPSRSSQSPKKQGHEGREPPTFRRAQKERIEKLRCEGWTVQKEKHGFKGVEWYENFRSRVEAELDELISYGDEWRKRKILTGHLSL